MYAIRSYYEIIAANRIDYLLTGKNPSGLIGQQAQNTELSHGQLQWITVKRHFMPALVDCKSINNNKALFTL